jgi:ribose 5-phosphate isomerase B
MKVYIASDHAGFELKAHLAVYLEENGIGVEDMGPYEKDPTDDYPDWISKVAEEVSKDPKFARGIVIGFSGQGEAMVANKFKGIRAGVYYGGPEEVITLLREHNDCNVLSLGAKFVTPEQAEKVVNMWIETQFSDDSRHKRRIDKMHAIDVRKSA